MTETRASYKVSASKYGNKKVEFAGILFDSKAELRRFHELKLLERAGEITNLELQPRFDLVVEGVKCGFYKGDFRYVDTRTGKEVVEDVKGVKTPVYRLKRKLVRAIYGVDVVEVS